MCVKDLRERPFFCLRLSLCLTLIVLLTACGGGRNAASQAQPTAGTPESGAGGELGVGDRQSLLGGGSAVVYAVDRAVAQPQTGTTTTALAVDAEICAGTSQPSVDLPVSPFQFYLVLDGNRHRSPSPGEKTPTFQSVTLAPGACTRGWVTFTLNPGEHPAEVAWATGRAGRELEAEWELDE